MADRMKRAHKRLCFERKDQSGKGMTYGIIMTRILSDDSLWSV